MAAETATVAPGRVTRESAVKAMCLVDKSTKGALARVGFEAFRFDVLFCPEENWMTVKVKIRPVRAPRD